MNRGYRNILLIARDVRDIDIENISIQELSRRRTALLCCASLLNMALRGAAPLATQRHTLRGTRASAVDNGTMQRCSAAQKGIHPTFYPEAKARRAAWSAIGLWS